MAVAVHYDITRLILAGKNKGSPLSTAAAPLLLLYPPLSTAVSLHHASFRYAIASLPTVTIQKMLIKPNR